MTRSGWQIGRPLANRDPTAMPFWANLIIDDYTLL